MGVMNHVRSEDGTRIAYSRVGTGPAVVLVGGGLDDGSENAPLAAELASRFRVYNYARRGRGESGDTQPYALEREIEDLQAVIREAGGPTHLFGASSGGALVLEAAARGVQAVKLAVYEVPYSLGAEAVAHWQRYVVDLRGALNRNDLDEALALFMRLAGSPDTDIESARRSEFWEPLLALAPTLAYDAAVLGDGPPPVDRLRGIAQPTLVMTGGGHDPSMQALQPNFFGAAADEIAGAVPGAVRRTIENEGHVAAPAVLGEVLRDFFLG